MKKRTQMRYSRTKIIIFAIIASIVLYLAGVMSGLQANKVLEKKTTQDILSLKNETQGDFDYLKQGTQEQINSLQDYVSFLDTNLKSTQLEQSYADTLSTQEKCNFSMITMKFLFKDLDYYWKIFSFRLEEYENTHPLTPDYLALRRQYTQLSIRTYILAKNMHDTCDSSMVYALNFYSENCTACVRQADENERFLRMVSGKGSEIILFPININSQEPIVQLIKEFYGINRTPAILVDEDLYQGRVFTAEELASKLDFGGDASKTAIGANITKPDDRGNSSR